MKTEIDLGKYEGWAEEPFADCENPDVPYAKWVLEYLPKKPVDILDVGCGSGVHTKWFNENGMKCFGITINKTDILNKKDDKVTFGSMCEIPFSASTFDLVFCLGALEHTTFPFLAMTEFNRVLKVEGYLFVDMPPLSNFAEFDSKFDYHKSILFPIQMRDLMRQTNFELIHGKDGYWTEEIQLNTENVSPQLYLSDSGARYIAKKKGDMKWRK